MYSARYLRGNGCAREKTRNFMFCTLFRASFVDSNFGAFGVEQMQRVIGPFNHVDVYDAVGRVGGYENPRVQETRCGSNRAGHTCVSFSTVDKLKQRI